MIKKIFYSLVLFPKITYKNKILNYRLFDIVEVSFWKIKVILNNLETYEEVIFSHIDISIDEKWIKTKNWIISSSNKNLETEIVKLVKENEVNDFNFFKNKEYYDKIPFWTVLTITSKCNMFCNYCFNDYDYSLKERNIRKWLSLDQYKQIVDILYKSWTRDIIITWWEPLLSPFIFELLEHIKNKWIFIRLNTNGTLLLDKILEKLNNNFSINIMVSMHEFNNKDYYEINKEWAKKIYSIEWLKWFENKYNKKVEQLKEIKKYKNLSLDFLTILTPKNILYLEKIYNYILSNFDIENWHFFRLYSTKTTKWISREMITLAIHKIYKLNKLYKKDFKIVDSVPFCVTKNTEISSQVIDGELSKHHNIKTIITTDWNIQIMSAFDSNLWSIFEKDLLKIWQWDFVQKMLNNWFLPKECDDCKYKEDCRWWSRMDANIYNWSYYALDPLSNLDNKKI